MRTRIRVGVVAAAVTLTALTPTTALATNCLVEVISAEKATFGTAWGREAVSSLARDPGQFEGAGSLGEVARFLARASEEECPPFEGEG